MDRLKKFLTEKKVNKTFKSAGAGHRLTDDTSAAASSFRAGTMQKPAGHTAPSVERIATSDMAAQAAFKRMNMGARQETATQRNIRMRALKELEEEKRQRELEKGSSSGVTDVPPQGGTDVREFEHSKAIEGVYFTCELLGEDVKMTKSEMKNAVEYFLRSQLDNDGIVASVLMIFSLNNADRAQTASETIQKYISNLLTYPDEDKYHRIRVHNKAFQDRVASVKGGVEFLNACGFRECMSEANETEAPEPYLVISEEVMMNVAPLVQAIEVLQTKQSVPLKLHRNPGVFYLRPDQVVPQPSLPSDFFNVSAAEVKSEQSAKTAQVEKMLTLRTREMREKDETLRRYRYKYTLLRVKFPDGYVLQGTFGCQEQFVNVREFVASHLTDVELPLFVLRDPAKVAILSDDTVTIAELGLAPAAVIHFEWDAEVLTSFAQQELQVPYLNEYAMSELVVTVDSLQ